MTQFTDLMGITIETGDAWLDRKLNSHICYKGGGNTTTTQLPKWAEQQFQSYGRDVQAAARSGELENVEGFNEDQQRAQQLGRDAAGQQGQTAGAAATAQQQALTGTGLFGAQDFTAQRDALSGQAREALGLGLQGQDAGAAARGTLGSARGQAARARAQEGAAVDLAGKFANLEQQDLAARRGAQQSAVGQTGAVQQAQGAAAQTLGQVGQQGQQQAQREADATFQGLQRQGQLLGTVKAGAGSQVSQGGGK